MDRSQWDYACVMCCAGPRIRSKIPGILVSKYRSWTLPALQHYRPPGARQSQGTMNCHRIRTQQYCSMGDYRVIVKSIITSISRPKRHANPMKQAGHHHDVNYTLPSAFLPVIPLSLMCLGSSLKGPRPGRRFRHIRPACNNIDIHQKSSSDTHIHTRPTYHAPHWKHGRSLISLPSFQFSLSAQ